MSFFLEQYGALPITILLPGGIVGIKVFLPVFKNFVIHFLLVVASFLWLKNKRSYFNLTFLAFNMAEIMSRFAFPRRIQFMSPLLNHQFILYICVHFCLAKSRLRIQRFQNFYTRLFFRNWHPNKVTEGFSIKILLWLNFLYTNPISFTARYKEVFPPSNSSALLNGLWSFTSVTLVIRNTQVCEVV